MNLWIALQPCQIWQIHIWFFKSIYFVLYGNMLYLHMHYFLYQLYNQLQSPVIKSIRTTVVCIYLVYVENGYPVWVSRINSFIITIIWFNLKTAVASSLHWINAKLIPVFIFTYCPDFSIIRLNKRNLKNRILYVCR